MLVVLFRAWVTETNDAPRASSYSMTSAPIAGEVQQNIDITLKNEIMYRAN
jgi:hypothetical protein